MQLNLVEIEGFRSVRGKLSLVIEPNVTVILGPNDHGKTNLLAAISFLNEDNKFDAENDLNWDLEGQEERFPSLRFHFSLTEEERNALRDLENEIRKSQAEANTAAAKPSPSEMPEAADNVLVEGPIALKDVPKTAEFYRQGVASALNLDGWANFYEVHSRNFIASCSDGLAATSLRLRLCKRCTASARQKSSSGSRLHIER